MATALNYAEELDFSKPMTDRWGGRLLTKSEADDLYETVSGSAYEFVAMNLQHLWDDKEAGKPLTPMSDSDLIALLAVSNDLRQIAERFSGFADGIAATVWALWAEQAGDDA